MKEPSAASNRGLIEEMESDSVVRQPRKYWLCKCGNRLPRQRQKCECGELRPKKRIRQKDSTLRDDLYPVYVETAREIHGVMDESCCACGKPRTQERHHDRDHDHRTGHRRGLLCGGNQGCNVLLASWVTPATATGIAYAKKQAGEPDAERWELLADYLWRVDAYYQEQAAIERGEEWLAYMREQAGG